MLPKHIQESNLIPDPHKRSGHWLDTVSGQIVSLGTDWQPGKKSGTVTATGTAPLDPKTVDPKAFRTDLVARAKEAGIKSAHTMSTEALQEKLAALEAESPETSDAPETMKLSDDVEASVGTAVTVLIGRFQNKVGAITEFGDGENFDGARVFVGGTECTFEDPSTQLRTATAEEKAAAEAEVTKKDK